MNNFSKPLVSICCITYNHEKFIQKAIEGFLMQKTNFEIELLIHDDSSTDSTPEIIKKFEKKYPEIIKPIYQRVNQYSLGIGISIKYQFPRVSGKYFALCEGDDYWIDPNKLQMQVDYLEANKDCAVCGTRVRREWLVNGESVFKEIEGNDEFVYYNYLDILYGRVVSHTSTNLFRKELIKDLISVEGVYNGDKLLLMRALQDGGYLVVLPAVTSVYRNHQGGVWSNATKEKRNKSYYALFCAYKEVIPLQYHNHALRLRSYYATTLFSISLKNFKLKQAFSYLRHLRPYPKNIKPFFKFLIK